MNHKIISIFIGIGVAIMGGCAVFDSYVFSQIYNKPMPVISILLIHIAEFTLVYIGYMEHRAGRLMRSVTAFMLSGIVFIPSLLITIAINWNTIKECFSWIM